MEKRKLDKWAELLLDTGKRSNLVNFKDTRGSTVEVVLPSSSAVFKKALGAARFVVFDPKIPEKEDDGDVLYDSELRPRNPKAEYIEKYSPLVRKSGELLLYSALGNPMPAVKNIFKKAKSAIEETGVNLAYMAFGFIHWWEGDKKNSYRAPILLSPITFEHESALDPYHIKTADDEIILNPTFSYKLASDYGIKLPEYEDGELCEYLDKIAALLSPLGYSVSAECKIGIFSFQKINMYRDICDNADRILNNPNVRAILGEESAKGEVSEIGDISRDIFEFNNIVDADSSQLEAIEMAKSGQSFVLEGPPGTGKSQTITNIIAECLSDGKKVLFVFERGKGYFR